jgi:hypothetical protein
MENSSVVSNNDIQSEKSLKLEYLKLKIQIVFGWLVVIPLGTIIVFWLRFIQGYRIKNLSEMRKTYRKMTKGKQKILICPNHLTMIDSLVLVWACGSMSWYMFNYRKLTWNVPAVENFKTTWMWSVVTYLSKCIPVDRQGSKEHHDLVLKKTIYFLDKGEVFTLFPEGGRSRKGRIDAENVRYGVGKIASEISNLKVLCIYMRGDHQLDYSEAPVKGETFELSFKELIPKTEYTGLRAHRDISQQIINTLKEMEDEYFQKHQSGQ